MYKKILYPRFANASPSVVAGPEIITTSAPALIPFGNAVDLDYVPLMLFERGVMDKYSFEFIRDCGLPWLQTTRERVLALRDEGFIEADLTFRDYLANDKQVILRADEEALKDYRSWVPIAQQAAKHWQRTSADLERSLGLTLDLIEKTPYGIVRFIQEHGLTLTETEVACQAGYLFNHSATTRDKHAQEIQKYVVRCYMASVHACLRLADRLQTSWYDWDNMSAFYQRKADMEMKSTPIDRYIKTGRVFFREFAAFQPRSTRRLIEVLHDSRITDLRNRIQDLATSGTVIDGDFVSHALAALEEAKSDFAKGKRLVGLSGWVTSFIPIPVVGGKFSMKAPR